MKNLFIIVEGPDNCGKTTLINNLTKHYNDLTLHVLHYAGAKHSTAEKTISHCTKLYNEMFYTMQHFCALNNTGIICDRSHLGELVYGPIYRGYSGDYVIDIEREHKTNLLLWDNLFLITLYDSSTNLIARDDGLSYSTDLDKKNQEISNFINAHKQSLITHKLLLNIQEHDATQALGKTINFIEGKRNDQ